AGAAQRLRVPRGGGRGARWVPPRRAVTLRGGSVARSQTYTSVVPLALEVYTQRSGASRAHAGRDIRGAVNRARQRSSRSSSSKSRSGTGATGCSVTPRIMPQLPAELRATGAAAGRLDLQREVRELVAFGE